MIASPKKISLADPIRLIGQRWIIGGQHTKPFTAFSEDIRQQLLHAAEFLPPEQPLVACYFSPDAWTLLTTERLIWRRAGQTMAVSWTRLVDVQASHSTILNWDANRAKKVSQAAIVTREGHLHTLELEAGQSFFGFWTALKMITRDQRHSSMGPNG